MIIRPHKHLLLLGATMILVACNDSDPIVMEVVPAPPPAPVTVSFQVTAINTTNAQPLSPVAILAHDADISVFTLGEPASVPLETLAEGGDNSELITAVMDSDDGIATASGEGPIPPGMNEAISITFEEADLPAALLSVTTMLVNTNDAFTGISNYALADMAVGDVRVLSGRAYDAGTELDDEKAIYIPGPAGGGEGFNATRDDEQDAVTLHSGVVTMDDGLVTSALSNQHKFDNPTIRVRIERTE